MMQTALVDVPVVLVGGLRSVEKINQYLDETKMEYVSLSRPLVREPNLILRWQQATKWASRIPATSTRSSSPTMVWCPASMCARQNSLYYL